MREKFIVPLLKKSQPDGLGDVRPITNICHCAKPLDSISSQQISAYFENNHFLLLFNLVDALVLARIQPKLINDARLGIDRNKVTLLMLYDFRKAFNSICHYFLLKILREFGFSYSVIRLFFAYLADWLMTTLGVGSCSYSRGVGRGSGPGRNLFLTFVNGILACFICLLILFIDDAQEYLHCTLANINTAIQRANSDFVALADWSHKHGLYLNPDKLQATIIGSRSNLLLTLKK